MDVLFFSNERVKYFISMSFESTLLGSPVSRSKSFHDLGSDPWPGQGTLVRGLSKEDFFDVISEQ